MEVEYGHGKDSPVGRSSIEEDGDKILCELIEDDIERADGHHFVPIIGIEDESLQDVKSGASTFMAEGAVFSDGALQIPLGASIEIGSLNDEDFGDDYIDDDHVDYNNVDDDDDYTYNSDEDINWHWRTLRTRRRRRLRAVRKRRVLIIRADANDSSTSADAGQLSNSILGTSGDKVTLKSQYKDCSHGKVLLAPYDNDTGVLEVQLKRNVNGKDKFTIQDAMIDAATEILGNLSDQADHVMLCMPKGTGDWVAYAYVDHWLSVFNDDWCQQLSTQVHEIGHNLGLSHSGKGGDDYSDKSGMMGYSFKDDNGPLQCFNPAKSYMLGWYKKSVVEWNPLRKGTWFGNIVGVTDFDGTETVVLKIRRKQNGKDLFVGYNRQKTFNQGVIDEGDNVVIVEQKEGYEVSTFLEGLHPRTGASKRTFYNFENSNRNLVIDFMRYGDSDSIDKAFVAVYFDDCKFPDCCSGSMCDEISEIAIPRQYETPLKTPSLTPTRAPTLTRNTDPTPVLYEILANSVENQGIYFEIFNPHSTTINLKNYRVCLKNGRNAEHKCMKLTNYELKSGEYYMLCKSKLSVPNSKTCHQEETFRILKQRKLFVSLTRAINNRNESVDKVEIPRPKNYLGEILVRKGSRMSKFCGNYCWEWSTPTA